MAAARAGIVVYSRDDSRIGGPDQALFYDESNHITIDHLDGTRTFYLHLEAGGNRVRPGDWVEAGEEIGRSGDTGWCQTPHLHYTVLSGPEHESSTSSFVDFPAHEDVPAEGDVVAAARAPAVPQALIDGLKTAFQASREAEQRGWLDLAWALAREGPDAGRYADYFYARVLAAWQARQRAALVASWTELAAVETPTPDQIVAAYQGLFAWPRENRELRAERSRLEATVRKWTGDAERWSGEKSAMRLRVEGLRHECHGRTRDAIAAYCAAWKKTGRRFRPVLAVDLKRVLQHSLAAHTRTLQRLLFEAARARPAHHDRIREVAGRAIRSSGQVTNVWAAHFPTERAAARQAFQDARTRCRDVVRQLEGK